ncbi:DUF86 domain-containing protein [Azoarcus taiwanensis]|uniref:DUF86 domain-containing protein n=1 Tax=Azoarcus taiwanensis TaxID=666964 RepID=A0A972FFL3_9RHOO|nr:DUF86 domain-containing protein [Azoarcus taiwanensis]
MSRDATVFLRHILLCLDKIATYTSEGRDAFLVDSRTQDAVIRNLEIIGQAVKDLGTQNLSHLEPEVPWHQIAGLRNVLAHQYLGVDIALVWRVVEDHLPALRSAVENALGDTSEG